MIVLRLVNWLKNRIATVTAHGATSRHGRLNKFLC